jgi:hypothetical protein
VILERAKARSAILRDPKLQFSRSRGQRAVAVACGHSPCSCSLFTTANERVQTEALQMLAAGVYYLTLPQIPMPRTHIRPHAFDPQSHSYSVIHLNTLTPPKQQKLRVTFLHFYTTFFFSGYLATETLKEVSEPTKKPVQP